MNSRAFTLALIIAGFAMFMVHTYIEDQTSSIIDRFGKKGTVVIAKTDIHELELIDDSKITVTAVPQSFMAPGHFKTVKEVENTIATVPILKGEQITKPRITYPGSKTGLSRQVSMGKRAMAIEVGEAGAASLLIKPGDRVDLVTGVDYSNSGQIDIVKTHIILQDVLVLSTGWDMTNSIPLIGVKTPTVIREMKLNVFSRYRTVTLELDPHQAQKLSFVINYQRKPILILRNNNDKERLRIPATRIFDILEDDKEEAKAFFKERDKKGN